jgi:hypothetical protein
MILIFRMELPKYLLLGDNTDFQGRYLPFLDYPRFIINLKDDEVEFIEEAEDLDGVGELNIEMEALIVLPHQRFMQETLRKQILPVIE